MRNKSVLIAGGALAAFYFIGAAMDSHHIAARAGDNGPVVTIGAPLPLPVTGTVGVNNFPATQPVSGTVNIGNFPANQNVTPSNTSASPLFIRDVDNPAAQPVLGGCDVFGAAGGLVTCNAILLPASGGVFSSVPAGKRLVIEAVSVQVFEPTGVVPRACGIKEEIAPNTYGFFVFALTKTAEAVPGLGGVPIGDVYLMSQQTRLYEAPGSTVSLEVFTNTNSPASAFLNFTGYFVNVP